MRSGEDFRIGSSSMRSKYKLCIPIHLPADLYREYSINEICHEHLHALSQCMVCCTSPMESKPQGRCGQHGLS